MWFCCCSKFHADQLIDFSSNYSVHKTCHRFLLVCSYTAANQHNSVLAPAQVDCEGCVKKGIQQKVRCWDSHQWFHLGLIDNLTEIMPSALSPLPITIKIQNDK